MAPVWELLGANDVLFGYQKLLHDKTSSDETVREYTMRIMKQIRLLIDEVNNELRKKNDGDEPVETERDIGQRFRQIVPAADVGLLMEQNIAPVGFR